MTMDPELPEKQEDILSILEEQFPNLPPRDDIISVLQETQLSAQGEWLSSSHCFQEGGLQVESFQEVNLSVLELSSPFLCASGGVSGFVLSV